jgi:hypothetical protein
MDPKKETQIEKELGDDSPLKKLIKILDPAEQDQTKIKQAHCLNQITVEPIPTAQILTITKHQTWTSILTHKKILARCLSRHRL